MRKEREGGQGERKREKNGERKKESGEKVKVIGGGKQFGRVKGSNS